MFKHVTAIIFLCFNLLTMGFMYTADSYLSQDLPFIQKILDHSLYPNDFYVQTLPQFPSLFIYMMAGLAKFFPIAGIYALVYVLVKYIFYVVVYQLAFLIFKKPVTAFLSVALFAFSPLINIFGLLTDQTVMKPILYHGSFAFPFLLLSIYLFLSQKFVKGLILLAVLFYFNALGAVHTACILLAATIYLFIDRKEESKSLLKGWGLFGVIVLPFIIWMLQRGTGEMNSPYLIEFFRSWHPAHYFISSWDMRQWLRIFLYVSFFVYVFRQSHLDSSVTKILKAMAFAIGVLWIVAILAGEVFTLRLPVILQFFRSDIFISVFGMLFAAYYLTRLIESPFAFNWVAAAFLLLFLVDIQIFMSDALLFVCACVVALLCSLEHKKGENNYFFVIGNAFLIAFIFLVPNIFPWGQIGFSLTLGLLCLLLVIFLKRDRIAIPFSIHGRAWLLVVVALVAYSDILVYRITEKSFNYEEPFKKDWHALQYWAKEHTPKDARFLTPPYLIGFRTFSQRGTFVERLDGGATHWSPGIEREWAKRLEKLGYGPKPVLEYNLYNPGAPLTAQSQQVYGALDEQYFVKIAKEFDLDYVVEEHFRVLNFPLVYSNEHFLVYKIPK